MESAGKGIAMVSDLEFRGIDHIHTYVGDILDEGEEVYPKPGMQSGATFRLAKQILW